MKKLWRLSAAAAMLGALALPFTASAQSGGPYTAGFQLQNLDAASATLTINYYDQTGALVAPVNTTLAGNASVTYFPLSAVTAGFNGSVVVSSDKPLASIVNVLTTDYSGGASYSGASGGATTVSLPLTMKENFGYNTWFNIQNAGSASATVNVAYAGTACTETQTVAPGASKTFDQKTNTCLPAGYAGAATVTNASTNQPLVGVVMQIVNGGNSLLAYNGFVASDASTSPAMPLVSTGFYGSLTGIQIQNTGASSTNITVSYTPGAGFPGTACSETKTIAAGASGTFFLPMPVACGTAFVGSAKVTTNSASQSLVAIVNQINSENATASAYSGAGAAAGTSKVSFPLIMDSNYGYFTGFSVANVGASTTTVSCTFSGSARTINGSVAPGASLTDVQLGVLDTNPDPNAGYVGSATCTATGGDAKIVGVANELGDGEDAFLTYNATNY